MITFLLGLLKIIGIVLLVLIGLILLLIVVVLFVPIRYYGNGLISDNAKSANIRATWILKMIRCKVDYHYPEKPYICIKVLWIDVLKWLEKKEERKKRKLEKKNKKTKKNSKKSEKWSPYINLALIGEGENKPEDNDNKPDLDNEKEKETDSNDEGVTEKLTLKQKTEKIIFKITSLYDKIKDVINNVEYYVNILQEKDTQLLLADAKVSIAKILKSIRPKRFRLNGEFGFETPDTTGKVFGYYCMVSSVIGEYIYLEPNFEEKIIKGDLYFKGKITIFVILINGIKIAFDKRLKPLIKKLKNGGKQNG